MSGASNESAPRFPVLAQPAQIGPHRLSGPLLLSPMAGVTDAPFRALARRFGAALAASEMTTADTRLWQTPKSRHRLDIDADARPRVVQIAGSEPALMAEAAIAVAARGADIIDINMGCPAKKVCRKLAGSALLQDERLVAEILAAVVGAVDQPVTLKTRTGWDPQHRNVVRVARIAEECGIRAIAVHGRTRACKYGGEAEFDTIARVKQSVGIPVFANGDIDCAEVAENVLRHTRADGLLIGRAAQGRPWIFDEISAYLATGRKQPPLSKSEMHAIILGHLDAMYAFYGAATGVRLARKHLTWYCRNLGVAEARRLELVRAGDAGLQRDMARRIFAAADAGSSLAA